jgi:hypothetical protein
MKEILRRLDRNLRHTIAGLLRLLPAQAEPECAYTDSGVLVCHKGQRYLVSADGNTVWLANPEWSIPLEGCRYPLAWAKWCLWRFFSRSPERLPVVLLAFALSGMGFIWLAICPPDENPFGEWALWLFPMLSTGFVLAMNLCLIWLLLAVILAATARPVAEQLVEAFRAAKAPALPAGEPALLEAGGFIAPDILVHHESPDEKPDVFADKLLAARRQYGADKYVIAAPYRSDKIAICCPADASVERPDEELKSRADMGGQHGDVSAETWDEYMEFLHRAATPLKNFCTMHRAKSRGAAAAVLAGLRVAMLLLAFVSPALAQPKTVRLKNYLAERATLIVPEQGAQFKASFQLAPITRTGDGKKNLLELLQSGTAFTDADNAGPLLAVYVGGKPLAPDVAGGAEPARATRAASVASPVSARPIPVSFDSANVSNSLEEGGKAVGSAFRAANAVMKEWWQSDLCTYLLHIIAALAGTLHMVAQICYNEHRMTQWGHIYGRWAFNIGNAAAFALMFITLPTLIAVALLIYIAFVEYEGFALYYIFCILWNVWTLLLILWFILIRMIVRFADFIIPNPKVRPTHGGPNFSPHNSPRLGAGQ